jgi:hypothetical protein
VQSDRREDEAEHEHAPGYKKHTCVQPEGLGQIMDEYAVINLYRRPTACKNK